MSAFRESVAEHPWIWRALQVSAAAALGTALPDVLAAIARLLS